MRICCRTELSSFDWPYLSAWVENWASFLLSWVNSEPILSVSMKKFEKIMVQGHFGGHWQKKNCARGNCHILCLMISLHISREYTLLHSSSTPVYFTDFSLATYFTLFCRVEL